MAAYGGGPPAGIQPPVQAPGGTAGAGIQENERLRELLALLHSPAGTGQQLEVRAQALDVESIIKALPEQPPPQYGELPGLGYLYPDAPEHRQATLVETTPDFARASLLRAIEVAAFSCMLPFSENKPGEWGKAILEMAQAYLLLDPTVDQAGVPVGAQAQAQGEAQAEVAHVQGEHAQAVAHISGGHAQHTARVKEAAGAGVLQDPETFTRGPAVGGHQEPPRVQPNRAEKAIEDANKPKTEVLKGARGDLPRPKPRIGS
jgi:hypothetical protein